MLAQFVVALGEGDRRVHDGRACGPGGIYETDRVGEHGGLVHHGLDGGVEHAALGGEVVLVLDKHDGRRGAV